MHIDHRLQDLISSCEGAYAESTLRSYAKDLQDFKDWCHARGCTWLPTQVDTLSKFVDDQTHSKRISTVKRALCAIKFAHRYADLDCPIHHSAVQLALRRAARKRPGRPSQSLGLTAPLLNLIVQRCPSTLAGMRNAALISVGYDTLCRSSELAAMQLHHLDPDGNGKIRILVPTSKADPFGNGRVAHLSPATINLVHRWVNAARLVDGPMFRGLHTRKVSKLALTTSSVRRLVKSATAGAGLCRETVAGLSGHSMRIGAAQDMSLAGFDTLAIMQVGGWKTPAVVQRYIENVSAQTLHELRWQYVSNAVIGDAMPSKQFSDIASSSAGWKHIG